MPQCTRFPSFPRRLALCGLLALPLAVAAQTASGLQTVSQAPRPLEQLRETLALTTAQQPLWQAYAGRLDAYTQLHYREKPAQPDDSAVRQFARLVDQQQNRLAALEDIERAAMDLYAALTPEQRKVADQRLMATLPVFASAGTVSAGTGLSSPGTRPSGPPPGAMRGWPGNGL
jgi:hypothetical protein